jgi:hypothetical protein
MFEGLSETEIWLLFAAAIAVSFYWGRATGGSTEAQAQRRELARTAAEEDFRRMPAAQQSEVDRLVAAGRIIDAVKLIRATLHLGLYEAKHIADLRKSHRT